MGKSNENSIKTELIALFVPGPIYANLAYTTYNSRLLSIELS